MKRLKLIILSFSYCDFVQNIYEHPSQSKPLPRSYIKLQKNVRCIVQTHILNCGEIRETQRTKKEGEKEMEN